MSVTFANAIRAVQAEILTANADSRLVGEMVGSHGGVAGTCAGLLEEFGADRVLELPVADRGTLALAVGMALGGRTIIVELSSTGRLPAVFEVLADAGAIARRGDFRLNLVVRVPYGQNAAGLDHPVGQNIHRIPGLDVLCPADAGQAAGLLRHALRSGRPTVFLEPRALYTSRGILPAEAVAPAPRTLRSGSHITLAAWGTGVGAALAAAEILLASGIDAEVIDLVALTGSADDPLTASVVRTGRLVVVHPEDAVLADAIRQIGLDGAFLHLESPLASARDNADTVVSAARSSVQY